MSNKIKDDNYIMVQGWMITKLGLTGKKLLLFALIYGFSQTPGNWFTGSAEYASEWCACSKSYIFKLLTELEQEKLIYKETVLRNDGGTAGLKCKAIIDTSNFLKAKIKRAPGAKTAPPRV